MVTYPADLLPKTQRPAKIKLRISPSYREKQDQRGANESQQERIHWLQKSCPSQSDKQGQNQFNQTGHQPILTNSGFVDSEVRSNLLKLPVPLELGHFPPGFCAVFVHTSKQTCSVLLLCDYAAYLCNGVHTHVWNENCNR